MQRKRLAEVVAMVVEAHRKGYSGGTHNRKKGAKKKTEENRILSSETVGIKSVCILCVCEGACAYFDFLSLFPLRSHATEATASSGKATPSPIAAPSSLTGP
ncbi:hypothetical protein Tsubulata_015479, partial [Turnera subulata]